MPPAPIPFPHWTPWFLVGAAFLLGAILGSFVNAAVYRLPRNISMLTRTRSFCPKCEHNLAWYDNVPILSYLVLRGRCRYCKAPIPRRYLSVELMVAFLFALSAFQAFVLNTPPWLGGKGAMPWIVTAVQMVLIVDLACIAFTDLETFYIPVQTTWPFILLGLALAPAFPELHLWCTPWTGNARWDALIDSMQGVVVGAGIPWLVGFCTIVFVRKEGMGSGDSHLLGMIGAMLGWKPAFATFMIAIFAGTFIGLSTIIWDRIQQARLGDKWKPRQASFELGDDEEQQEPGPDWPMLAMGGGVMAFECVLLLFYMRGAVQLTYTKDVTLISFTLGMLIGALLFFGYFVKKQMVQLGTWPKDDRIEENEEGKKVAVMVGNYIPFGPSLALAGVIVIFYDPAIRLLAEWWFTGATAPWWAFYSGFRPFLLPLIG